MTPDDVPSLPVPPRAVRARERAFAAGFPYSCSEPTGRPLAVLAASRPAGRVAESGTGFGVGTAWLAAGLGEHGTLVTVEHEPSRAAAAVQVLSDDPRFTVLTGDWRLLAAHAPFDLFFCDGGGKRDAPDAVVDLLAPGGLLVLDDFTPDDGWPPRYAGEVDALRLRYLTHPALVAVPLAVRAGEGVLVAARR